MAHSEVRHVFVVVSGALKISEYGERGVALSTTYADCFDAGGYFLLSADNDGDDTAMYWADVKVYDGIVDP